MKNPYSYSETINKDLNLKLADDQLVFVTDLHNSLGDGVQNYVEQNKDQIKGLQFANVMNSLAQKNKSFGLEL